MNVYVLHKDYGENVGDMLIVGVFETLELAIAALAEYGDRGGTIVFESTGINPYADELWFKLEEVTYVIEKVKLTTKKEES